MIHFIETKPGSDSMGREYEDFVRLRLGKEYYRNEQPVPPKRRRSKVDLQLLYAETLPNADFKAERYTSSSIAPPTPVEEVDFKSFRRTASPA